LKLRATWSIAALRDAVGAGSEVLVQLDDAWDSLQRKLNFSLGLAGEDKDKDNRDAAARLRDVLLLGNGTAQTTLGWNEEVDFGRQQVELTAKGALAEDAKKVGVQPLLAEISAATEALSCGLGRGSGQRRAGTRAARVREALAECAAAFNGIHSDLEWLIAHAEPGEARARLEQMLAPFQALLDRYPGGSPDQPEPVPAPQPAPAAPPA
jgi:hypothetical protein